MDEAQSIAHTIVERAQQISDSAQRRAYLEQACGGDFELRSQVETLTRAHEEGGSGPDHIPTLAVEEGSGSRKLDPVPLPEKPLEGEGSRIGPYKLLQPIGEGGMGAVYIAEQQQPVRRMVALKVIKAGMDSRQVIARFEAERQALALMDHPHIAKVLDGGTTQSGRPYFVMELVKGVPITKYCDEHRLTLRQRLELFVPVCQAIQHAHQKGIIHRDIKPSNVLVASYDGKPVPKVIDFGVAKAMGQKLTEQTVFTALGHIVGTLEYMSPEQAELNALDIDTRSDVYALGVLLYELLTGTTPLTRQRLKDAAILEVLRLIREEEPPRPSTRLSESKESLASVSVQRHLEPAALVKALRGEVDWIVMKALEKDRGRRYETANGLARDIQRYLAEEPVEAGPPSATYRLRKMAWKHRRGMATAAALLVLLTAAAVVSISLAVWAMRAEKEAVADRNRALTAETETREQRDKAVAAEKAAKQSEQDAKAVLGFFQDKVLSAGRPKNQEGGLGKDVKLSEAVNASESAIVKAFADRPLVEAAVRYTLGTTYWFLGDFPSAIHQYERTLALREANLGTDHLDTLDSRNKLAVAYWSAGRLEKALPLFEQTLKQREAKLGFDHPDTLRSRDNLALGYSSAGRTEEALRLREETLKQFEAKLGPDHPDTLITRNNLAGEYWAVGRLEDTIRLFEQTLKQREAKFGTDHPDTLMSRNNLAVAYWSAGRTEEAIRLYEQVLQQYTAKLGTDHPNTLDARNGLALAYMTAGRTKEAIRLHEQNLKLYEAKLGLAHPKTVQAHNNLAASYEQAGEFAKAEPLYRAALEQTRKRYGTEDARTAEQLAALGANLLRQHRYIEAEPLLRDDLKIREKKQADDWTAFEAQSLLGGAFVGQKKYTDAEPLLLKGYEGMKKRETKIPAYDKARLSEALERLVQLYEANGKKEQAEKWRKEFDRSKKPTLNQPPKK